MGEWIFKSISLSFFSDQAVHIAGSNGSGKSTLLKTISGITLPSIGRVNYFHGEEMLNADQKSNYTAICAPFIQLFDHHLVNEAVAFHMALSPLRGGMTREELLSCCYLENSALKRVGDLSSGMKQRLKIALTILSAKPVLLLDEPCSNLDDQAVEWYQKLLRENSKGKLLLISSNNKEEEHFICKKSINLADFK